MAAEFEGHVDGARECAAQAVSLLGGDAVTSDAPPPWWGREPEGATCCTVTHEVGRLPALLEALADVTAGGRASGALRGSVGVGTVQVALRGDPPAVIGAISGLRAASSRFGGSVVLRDAPAEVRSETEVWGPVQGLDLMRAVKARFDPSRRLAPGRFVGGI